MYITISMTHLDDVVKKITSNVQAKCAERLEEAAQRAKNVCKPHDAIEEYGISSILKRKRGLL